MNGPLDTLIKMDTPQMPTTFSLVIMSIEARSQLKQCACYLHTKSNILKTFSSYVETMNVLA